MDTNTFETKRFDRRIRFLERQRLRTRRRGMRIRHDIVRKSRFMFKCGRSISLNTHVPFILLHAFRAIEAASDAFESWSCTPLAKRKKYLQKILQEYMKRKDRVAEALRRELGAPKALAEEQQAMLFAMHLSTVLKIADDFEWTQDLAGRSLIVKEPIGVVGCITPWNWPTNQIGAKIAPAILCGCTVILKPSEVTPVNAIIIAEAIHASGLPPGVFNLVLGRGSLSFLFYFPKRNSLSVSQSS